MDNDLLLSLFALQERINSHGGVLKGESMIERYHWYVNHSDKGRDCAYARKCRDLFNTYDYDTIRQMFLETLELFRVIEGPSFGEKK